MVIRERAPGALSKDPGRRPANAPELAAMLREAAEAMGVNPA